MSSSTDEADKLQALRAQVELAANPAERVEATLKLAEKLWLSDPVTAKPLLEQVVAEADAAGRPKDRGRAAYMLGELLRRAGDLDGSARCAELVFKVADATGDRRQAGSILSAAYTSSAASHNPRLSASRSTWKYAGKSDLVRASGRH